MIILLLELGLWDLLKVYMGFQNASLAVSQDFISALNNTYNLILINKIFSFYIYKDQYFFIYKHLRIDEGYHTVW